MWPEGEIFTDHLTDENRGRNCDEAMLFSGFDRCAHATRGREKFLGMFANRTP
jgi:hypothetical protein